MLIKPGLDLTVPSCLFILLPCAHSISIDAKEEPERKDKEEAEPKVEEAVMPTPKQKITIYLSMTNVKADSSFCKLKLKVWSPAA